MKNKHAKGPDGQPLIAFNSGRGRGRPKKNSLGSRNHVEPTSSYFFRTIDKVGGPIEPTTAFNEIYTEIFIKKKAKVTNTKDEEGEGSEKEDDQDENNLTGKQEAQEGDEGEAMEDDDKIDKKKEEEEKVDNAQEEE